MRRRKKKTAQSDLIDSRLINIHNIHVIVPNVRQVNTKLRSDEGETEKER